MKLKPNLILAVLVTGTSSGIGKSIALHLDKLGYKVYAGVRKESDGEKLKKLSSPNLRPVIIDVTIVDTIVLTKQLIEKELKNDSSFALVNNAGLVKAGPIEFQPLEEFKQQIDVNLFGVYSVIQQFIPLLRMHKGHIINISSISGKRSLPFLGTYGATKFALEAISDALRLELKPWNIKVSNVLPGDVQTPIWGKASVDVENMIQKRSPHEINRYKPVVDMMKEIISKPFGIHPDNVAFEVAKLLRSKNPKARVLIGKNTNTFAFMEKLPTRLRDWIIYKKLPNFGTVNN